MTPPTRVAGSGEKHFNQLTPAEAERLALLLEELGEAQQAIGKVLRHGYESHNPTIASVSPSNREALEAELGHVQYAIELMVESQDLNALALAGSLKRKCIGVLRWLHHQQPDSAVRP